VSVYQGKSSVVVDLRDRRSVHRLHQRLDKFMIILLGNMLLTTKQQGMLAVVSTVLLSTLEVGRIEF